MYLLCEPSNRSWLLHTRSESRKGYQNEAGNQSARRVLATVRREVLTNGEAARFNHFYLGFDHPLHRDEASIDTQTWPKELKRRRHCPRSQEFSLVVAKPRADLGYNRITLPRPATVVRNALLPQVRP